MKLVPANQAGLVEAIFALAILIWMASLVTMMHVGYMIAPFTIPLFIVGLIGHFTWRRAVLATMGLAWACWMLWVAFGGPS